MSNFVVGQRWVVDSEPELGLGIVTSVELRTVTLFFDHADCERRYASQDAPLTRIRFEIGDEIQLIDGTSAVVEAIHEKDGILIYDTGGDRLTVETSLSGQIQLNQPFMRLITGQLDKPSWFNFRRQLDAAMTRVWNSRLTGLLGARANLVPHQLYVAKTACEQDRVRVLLADEVGLGKTIEACLILCRLLQQERTARCVIAVPEALQVQWLVELVRKFSIHPELYQGADHDFEQGQIHIVPHQALQSDAERIRYAAFDMAIIDEAHHIEKDTEAFATLASLSEHCRHMVLLTATPEQLGVESHFQRLQLLDPAKFNDIQHYQAQEKQFAELNSAIQSLDEKRDELLQRYELSDSLTDDQLVNQLLDCHGVGRVMFRNVRSAIQGFPKRIAIEHPLDDVDLIEHGEWATKFEWLANWLKTLPKNEKVLVICHRIEEVLQCEHYLWERHGIHLAVFHEDQNLIERDKAAAYFADHERGSQLLICSEIGSEGRNFQFSCHLVCLDIPHHPDLLEQRIGRLDRIGQKRDVHIHFPVAIDDGDHHRFHWYHETLNCIETLNPAAGTVHEAFWPEYCLAGDNEALREPLREQAHQRVVELHEEISQGRDALLEMNSCRQPEADNLAQHIADFEATTPLPLVEYASELLQFHFEALFDDIYSLVPSDKTLVQALPGIPREGTEVTFSREVATHREDIVFLTWDSPFITGLWELLHHSELGSASVAMLPNKQLPAGHCLLEACFDITVQSPERTECWSFLNQHSIRTLILDVSDKDLSGMLPEDSLEQSVQPVKKPLARNIIKAKKTDIPSWFQKNETFAQTQLESVLQKARDNVATHYEQEIIRTEQLARKNDHVTDNDVAQLKTKQAAILSAFNENTTLNLSAIRLIVITEPQNKGRY